jgi:hypothetical protein
VKEARREVKRCRKAIENGSPVKFWLKRIKRARQLLTVAVATLAVEEAALEALAAATPLEPPR